MFNSAGLWPLYISIYTRTFLCICLEVDIGCMWHAKNVLHYYKLAIDRLLNIAGYALITIFSQP